MLGERQRGRDVGLWRLERQRRIVADPARVLAEPTKAAEIFEPFLRRDWRVGPRLSECAYAIQVQLFQQAAVVHRAEGEQLRLYPYYVQVKTALNKFSYCLS